MQLRELLRKPFVNTPYASEVNLAGKHVIVTGVGPGSLGYATARTLARWGALVIVTTRRNTAAAIDALTADLAEDGVAAKIDGRELDLCEASSVNQFVQWYLDTHGDRLDVLVNLSLIHI